MVDPAQSNKSARELSIQTIGVTGFAGNNDDFFLEALAHAACGLTDKCA
jgi:hypothetical protein